MRRDPIANETEQGKQMDLLEQARLTINEVDREMAKLFVRRMEAAAMVAEYKRQTGLPILDENREAEVVRRNSELVEDPVFREYYVGFIRGNMEISRAYQSRLLEGMRVAYSEIEDFAAFSSPESTLMASL